MTPADPHAPAARRPASIQFCQTIFFMVSLQRKSKRPRRPEVCPGSPYSANSLARKLATFGESGNTVSRAESQGFNGHGGLAETRGNQAAAGTEEEDRP